METRVISAFWLLWKELLWTWVFFFFESLHSVLSGLSLGGISRSRGSCLALWGASTLLVKSSFAKARRYKKVYVTSLVTFPWAHSGLSMSFQTVGPHTYLGPWVPPAQSRPWGWCQPPSGWPYQRSCFYLVRFSYLVSAQIFLFLFLSEKENFGSVNS